MSVWEIREIDSVLYGGNWIWNDSIVVAEFEAKKDEDVVSEFLKTLAKHHITFNPNEIEIVEDEMCIEIKTNDGIPIFATLKKRGET